MEVQAPGLGLALLGSELADRIFLFLCNSLYYAIKVKFKKNYTHTYTHVTQMYNYKPRAMPSRERTERGDNGYLGWWAEDFRDRGMASVAS